MKADLTFSKKSTAETTHRLEQRTVEFYADEIATFVNFYANNETESNKTMVSHRKSKLS